LIVRPEIKADIASGNLNWLTIQTANAPNWATGRVILPREGFIEEKKEFNNPRTTSAISTKIFQITIGKIKVNKP
jgi:hypothetical protein